RKILTAAARAYDDADPPEFVARHGFHIDAGIREGLRHGGRRERHGARYVWAILHLHVLGFIEFIRNLPGDLNLINARVEAGDTADAAHAVPRGLPKRFPPDSVRADCSNSGDDYAAHENFAFDLAITIG